VRPCVFRSGWDELGLYRALAQESARTADELASESGCHPRLVREWLDAQAAAGLAEYDSDADQYSLSAEAAMALADDGSAVFVARAMNALGSMFMDVEKMKAAFTGNCGLAWAIITRACSRAPSGSSAPAIAPICQASGFLRWMGWRTSSGRARVSRMLAVATVPRWWPNPRGPPLAKARRLNQDTCAAAPPGASMTRLT
jgi:hypothetical protein